MQHGFASEFVIKETSAQTFIYIVEIISDQRRDQACCSMWNSSLHETVKTQVTC